MLGRGLRKTIGRIQEGAEKQSTRGYLPALPVHRRAQRTAMPVKQKITF